MSKSAQHQVSTSREAIWPQDGTDSWGRGNAILIKVPAGQQPIYVGGSDVTTSNGFLIEPTESVRVYAGQEGLWGVTASLTSDIYVLVSS